jgi:protein-tyrosine phosphatase
MSWADHNDDLLYRLIKSGTWMQLTAGSILGAFGQRAKRRAEEMLSQGWVHIVASDAHNVSHRPPAMGQAFRALCDLVGAVEAENLIKVRPGAILGNRAPEPAPALPYLKAKAYEVKSKTFLGRAVRYFRG